MCINLMRQELRRQILGYYQIKDNKACLNQDYPPNLVYTGQGEQSPLS